MYALVIFTLTFMAVLNAVFQAQAPKFAQQAGGQYQMFIDASPTGGVQADDLRARDDLDQVAPVIRGIATGRSPQNEDQVRSWLLSGIDPSFVMVEPPPLAGRSSLFASDSAAWSAVALGDGGDVGRGSGVAGSDRFVILDESRGLRAGDAYQFENRDGTFDTYTVAGLTRQGWLVDAGVLVSVTDMANMFDGPQPVTRFYATVAGGEDPAEVSSRLTNDGLEQGMDARTFLSAAQGEVDEQEGFLQLLRVYLGFGLLIGLAGLGVVLVRAVRERRRQIGIMRALGVAAPSIRLAFMVEAVFVTVQGVVLGVGMGVLSSWQVLTKSDSFEADLGFVLPVTPLVVVAVVCAVASLAVAAIPAARAGTVTPAVALRVAT